MRFNTFFLLLISSVVTFVSCGDSEEHVCPHECPANEVWDKCSNNCQQSCPSYLGVRPLPRCTDECIPRCKCMTGFVRKTFDQNSICICQDDCGALQCTNPNEEWNDCGSACEDNCDMVTGLEPYKDCIMMCVPKCQCKSGYVRQSDTNSTCVPRDQCQSRCGPNQDLYFDCKEICQDYCSFPKPPAKCKTIVGSPEGVCKCKDNYMWNNLGQCVPCAKCPVKTKCGPCQVWTNCRTLCESTCADVLGLRPEGRMCAYICFTNSCKCAPGTVQISDQDDRCVLESVCKMLFPPMITTTTTSPPCDASTPLPHVVED